MRQTETIAPLKHNNFEIALFSFRTLKTALRKQRYLCQKFLLPIPFHAWKISHFEHISHACLFTRVSFGTLSVSNSSLLWTKALACKRISTVTLIVLLITYVHILVPRGRPPFGQHQESILGADRVLTKRSTASGDENERAVSLRTCPCVHLFPCFPMESHIRKIKSWSLS